VIDRTSRPAIQCENGVVGPSLGEKTLQDVLAAFASATPTPGGGSACAAGAAIGVALLIKTAAVASIPQHTLAGIQGQLIDAVDDDAAAYQHVVSAQKQPRNSQAERTLRTAAIQLALRHATDVPLSIMRLSAEGLAEAQLMATRIRRSTAADAVVAVMLLRAGFEGARATVDANLMALSDHEYVGSVSGERDRLVEQAARAASEAERLLRVG
jgi:formiminotetrahydrofolate cyclodeaminase